MSRIIASIIFFFVISVSSAVFAADNVVLQWNQATLNAIKNTNTAPPIAARALAIVHTSIFNAWAAYNDRALGTTRLETLRRPSNEFTDANKQRAISFAAYNTLIDLFPTQILAFQSLMTSLGFNPSDTSIDPATPTGIGNIVAADILQFRRQDGSNQLANEVGTPPGAGPYSDYTGYKPVNTSSSLNDPNRWQPLSVNGVDQRFLTPHWGLVIPFALSSGADILPCSPALHPSRKYNIQAKQILKLSANLNDRTKSIAEYWADGPGTVTPPGHWNLIAQFVSRRDNNSLDKDVKLFFILDNALLDSSISCWFIKRFYDYVRPVSSIRFLFNGKNVQAWAGPGQGTQTILGQNWKSYIGTPPFAEYVSGHSTFSAAAAEVLTLFTCSSFFGDSVTIAKGSSTIEPGITPSKDVVLCWDTFKEAANQAGISRRYGGIHFKDGDIAARKLGKKIGIIVFNRAREFIRGVVVDQPCALDYVTQCE